MIALHCQVVAEIKIQYDTDIDFPLAHFIVCCGFFLILAVEQLVVSLQESWTTNTGETEPLLGGGMAGSYQSTSHHHGEVSEEAHPHSHLPPSVFQVSSLRSLMLLMALSFHSVFEGLAIGLQGSSSQLLSLFIAVIVHKAVMAFSLGLNLAQSSLTARSFVISNVIFSLASPLGVAIGMALEGIPPSLPSDLCNGVLQGKATSTHFTGDTFQL